MRRLVTVMMALVMALGCGDDTPGPSPHRTDAGAGGSDAGVGADTEGISRGSDGVPIPVRELCDEAGRSAVGCDVAPEFDCSTRLGAAKAGCFAALPEFICAGLRGEDDEAAEHWELCGTGSDTVSACDGEDVVDCSLEGDQWDCEAWTTCDTPGTTCFAGGCASE